MITYSGVRRSAISIARSSLEYRVAVPHLLADRLIEIERHDEPLAADPRLVRRDERADQVTRPHGRERQRLRAAILHARHVEDVLDEMR
jgi:hypothetical protein